MVGASKSSEPGLPDHIPPLGYVALLCTTAAASILVAYLLRRPPLTVSTKLWLFLGLAVLPALGSATGTTVNLQTTTEVEFCGSCHVMDLHVTDATAPESQSLAARHSRNPFFGGRSCYVCHSDYGKLGYFMTKLNGMKHVQAYYLGGFRKLDLDEAVPRLALFKPYDNTNCRQCHTTTLADWRRVPDHISLKEELDANRVSCASAGCHGYAHPFTKPESVPGEERASGREVPESASEGAAR